MNHSTQPFDSNRLPPITDATEYREWANRADTLDSHCGPNCGGEVEVFLNLAVGPKFGWHWDSTANPSHGAGPFLSSLDAYLHSIGFIDAPRPNFGMIFRDTRSAPTLRSRGYQEHLRIFTVKRYLESSRFCDWFHVE